MIDTLYFPCVGGSRFREVPASAHGHFRPPEIRGALAEPGEVLRAMYLEADAGSYFAASDRTGQPPLRKRVAGHSKPYVYVLAFVGIFGNLEKALAFDSAEINTIVIVHELLHVVVPNHGKLWKSLMHAHLGNWEEISRRLNSCVPEG